MTDRNINQAGFSTKDKLADVIHNGVWRWPMAWYDLFPVLNLIQCPTLNIYRHDQLLWCDRDGNKREFSVSFVWDTIRDCCDSVPWATMVWFPHCIPRYAFHLWLVFKRRLKTQDTLKQWDVGVSTNLNLLRCSLCKLQPDSHEHLFFECPFSLQVWSLIKPMAGMHDVSARWEDIVARLQPISRSRTAKSVIGRLLLAASTYFIWQERNNRLFGKGSRSASQVRDVIITNVRLKLLTFRFKNTTQVTRILDSWNMPRNFVIHG